MLNENKALLSSNGHIELHASGGYVEVDANGGVHPAVGDADTRLLNRMRSSAVSAVYGAGMHPNRKLWVSEPRIDQTNNFKPQNKFR